LIPDSVQPAIVKRETANVNRIQPKAKSWKP